jgi:hypothetical protein
MKKYILLFCLFCLALSGFSQGIQSPSQFLGYKLGERFTPHFKVLEYFKHLASNASSIKIQEYGSTYEGRPLMVAYLSSAQHIENLEKVRTNNLMLAGLHDGKADSNQPAVVWLSYNVHGNEAAATETAMLTAFELLNTANAKTQAWLQNTVVILDPCMNPDGRERYVNFFNSVRGLEPDAYPYSREHIEPWPGGRTNHYYFDLNRDWAWQTQIETRQRMSLYNQWLPHIHVDFHEQGYDEPYYFAPAAEPFHEDVTPWQREFQTLIGRNNARYFDSQGWLYFTKERFDLLYPSYGDTYPTYNGAIGMTYEQGGSGRAGLAVVTSLGDTLTLQDRILHHHTTGLSTVEMASSNARRLVAEYRRYFEMSRSSPSGKFKSYIIKWDGTDRLKNLATLLSRNGIKYGFGVAKKSSGYNYFSGKSEQFSIVPEDMVISSYQPKSVLVKVLFEPNTYVADSVTYDITAWALPYAYGLKAFATKEVIKPLSLNVNPAKVSSSPVQRPVAYVTGWGSVHDVKFLCALLKRDIKVRHSQVPFEVGKRRYNTGSLIITRSGNERLAEDFDRVLVALAEANDVSLEPLASGFVEKGADLGSDKIKYIRRPRVALAGAEEASSTSFGEVWHYFDQQINYPLTVLRPRELKSINLNPFDVIIYASGDYPELAGEKMQAWIQAGGKLIVMENAITSVVGKKGFNISLKENQESKSKAPYQALKEYQNRERESLQTSTLGAIYKVHLDASHPLAYGLNQFYHTLMLDTKLYNYLDSGWNVGYLKKDNYVSGFVGNQTRKSLVDGLLFGVQELGNGAVVYLGENPLFRGFWENGKLLFGNAVFMVGP